MVDTIPPVPAYIISVVVVISTLFLFRRVYLSLFLGTFLYGALTLDLYTMISDIYIGSSNIHTLRLLTAIIQALFIAGVLKETGVLDDITRGLMKVNIKFATFAIPALIGLIPMPGGALVSAMMTYNLYFKDLNLDRSEASFINYWFRHIWVPVWPLYQAIILTAALLQTTVYDVIKFTYPAAVSGILIGIIYGLYVQRKNEKKSAVEGRKLDFVKHMWIFGEIAILALVLKIDISITLLITLISILIVYQPDKKAMKQGLKTALDPKLLLIIFLAMIFREFIVTSGAAHHMFQILRDYNINKYLVAFLIPFSLGIATAGEFVFAAIAFPILLNIIYLPTGGIDPVTLLMGFTGGWIGVMLSPAHLCVILTVEYFKADIVETFKHVYLAAAATVLLVVIIASMLL